MEKPDLTVLVSRLERLVNVLRRKLITLADRLSDNDEDDDNEA